MPDYRQYRIPFNRPFIIGQEMEYIQAAVASGQLSGNGPFTRRCQDFFEQTFGFGRCLLTHSCTDALEMAALLSGLGPGDEVIMPAYTFVSTANAFVLRGAKVVFADSSPAHPNLDPAAVHALITERTKALVVVHYAGMACDMEAFTHLARKHGLILIEDAAQAICAYYQGRALGSFGDLATFSFHETKNVIAGEGGMLVVNRPEWVRQAEIIWEKGTNRVAFHRGETARYEWVGLGSSFLPSELNAAFLMGQLEHLDQIQARRQLLWQRYAQGLAKLAEQNLIRLPQVPVGATHNAHLFYVLTQDQSTRDELIDFLANRGILAVFHYLPLHASPYYQAQHNGRSLPHCELFARCLLRLPLYYELSEADQDFVIAAIYDWAKNR